MRRRLGQHCRSLIQPSWGQPEPNPFPFHCRLVTVPWAVGCLLVCFDPRPHRVQSPPRQALMTRPSLHPPSSRDQALSPPPPASSPNTGRNTKWPTMKSDFQLDKAHQMLMYSTGDMLAQHLRHAEWDGSLNSHERSEFWSEILGSEWNQRHLRSLEGGSLLSHSRP